MFGLHKYGLSLGLYKLGLYFNILASISTSSVWPRMTSLATHHPVAIANVLD